MNNRIDPNTMTVLTALVAQTINSATTTDGEIIDTQNAEDKNFAVAFDAFTSGDFSVEIFEDDVIGFGSATKVAAANMEGSPYDVVITPDPVAKQVFVYHPRRTMTKRFLRLSIVSADTPVANLSAKAILGSLVASDDGVNPQA